MPFGQLQDTELWNNQFPETKILGLPVSRRMRDLVNMASRDKVDVDTFHKGIQYALEKLGKSKFGFERTAVSNFKSKRHEGSGNELVDYSRAPCLGADQKARGLWERDWRELKRTRHLDVVNCMVSNFRWKRRVGGVGGGGGESSLEEGN